MPGLIALPMAPFTFIGPVLRGDHFELRIAELPDFYLAAETKEQVYVELGAALGAFLQSYSDRGEPLPAIQADRWIVLAEPPMAARERPFHVSKQPELLSGGMVPMDAANFQPLVAA